MVVWHTAAADPASYYNLADQFSPAGILPETAGESGWFDHVLRAARTAAGDERIVLVIDGLDKTEHVDGDLPLGLPNTCHPVSS